MPKYLIQASYTPAGVKGVQSAGGSSRREAIAQLVESAGGSLECFYFAFGDADVYTIIDLPDNESAAALAMAVNGSGATWLKTTVLLTPEDVDAASKKTFQYRAPGS